MTIATMTVRTMTITIDNNDHNNNNSDVNNNSDTNSGGSVGNSGGAPRKASIVAPDARRVCVFVCFLFVVCDGWCFA